MAKKDWKRLWDEREDAVRAAFGETMPPGQVLPFSWKNYILPGACALAFGPTNVRKDYLYMTLGITQPHSPEWTPFSSWEFAIRSNEFAVWPTQVLYDLLTCWLQYKGNMSKGMYLPLIFFLDQRGSLCAGITSDSKGLGAIGQIRGLYLWDDEDRYSFQMSSGSFGLLTAVGVTDDERHLAEEASPLHLLLLLKRLGIGQTLLPHRRSIKFIQGFDREWEQVRMLSNAELNRSLVAKSA